MPFKLEFGISPPVDKIIAWGARAIYYRPGDVSIVWDRQDLQGGTIEQRQAFLSWLNTKGMQAIKSLTSKEHLDPNENRLCSTQVDGWCIVVNPRKSYGYLYIGVYPIDTGDPHYFPG